MRLLVEGGCRLPAVSLGRRELKWPNPTRPGDTLQVESEVLDLRPSQSRPDRGCHSAKFDLNQRRGVQRLTGQVDRPASLLNNEKVCSWRVIYPFIGRD